MDSDVYDIETFEHIQTIEPCEVTGGISLDSDFIVLGFLAFGSM